jgi:AlwI restriction endonuclease
MNSKKTIVENAVMDRFFKAMCTFALSMGEARYPLSFESSGTTKNNDITKERFLFCLDEFALATTISISNSEEQDGRDCRKVLRHYRAVKKAYGGRPTYYLFVAPIISPTTVAYFFGLNQTAIDINGGGFKIIPLTLSEFEGLAALYTTIKSNKSKRLSSLFNTILSSANKTNGEIVWRQLIGQQIID